MHGHDGQLDHVTWTIYISFGFNFISLCIHVQTNRVIDTMNML